MPARLVHRWTLALVVLATIAIGAAAHAAPMRAFLFHRQNGVLFATSAVVAGVGFLLLRRRGWSLPLLCGPSLVAVLAVVLGLWRGRGVHLGADATLAARASSEATAAAARFGVMATGAILAALLLGVGAFAIGWSMHDATGEDAKATRRERVALIVSAAVVILCALWTWRRSAGAHHVEVVGFAAAPALLAVVAILHGAARLREGDGEPDAPEARTRALASVLLALGGAVVAVLPLYVFHAAFMRVDSVTLDRFVPINAELDRGMFHGLAVAPMYVCGVLVLGVSVARRRTNYLRALAFGSASLVPFVVSVVAWLGFGLSMDRLESARLSYKPADAHKLVAFEPGYSCDDLKESELLFIGSERLHRGNVDIGPSSRLDDFQGCVDVASSSAADYVAVQEGGSFARLGCFMRASWLVRHNPGTRGPANGTCSINLVSEDEAGRAQCAIGRFASCFAEESVLELWLKADGQRFTREVFGTTAVTPLADADLAAWARDRWSQRGKHTAYDDPVWDVAIVRADAKTPMADVVTAQRALVSLRTASDAGRSRPALSVAYGFIEPRAEERYDLRSGSAACPRPLSDFCRSCIGFATRAQTPHASRIEQSTRVGLGTCGDKYRVFAEQDGLFDGRGIVEFFGPATWLVGAVDDRAPIACAKFGEVPSCTPQIVWSDAGAPRPAEWPTDVPTPRVRVLGHISGDNVAEDGLIFDVIGRQKLRRCYFDALDRDPRARGRITLVFMVDPDGKIRDVREQSTTLGDDAMRACVVGAFAGTLTERAEVTPANCSFEFVMSSEW